MEIIYQSIRSVIFLTIYIRTAEFYNTGLLSWFDWQFNLSFCDYVHKIVLWGNFFFNFPNKTQNHL